MNMQSKLSVVINTFNEEENLPHAIQSISEIADEIVVVDTESEDSTIEIAKKLGAKVYRHKKVEYVEPVRNFAITKASNDWILILDADEKIPKKLAIEIKKIIKNPKGDYYRLPRKNIIFGKWIANSRWWPDFNIRLFRKGFVVWNSEIHRIPVTQGVGIDLPDDEEMAIIHNNYRNIDEYLERMIKYSKIQAEELTQNGYKFDWSDVVAKPLSEFLSRYFAGGGYKDGLHGLVLSLLQGFSEFLVYVRVWGGKGYPEKELDKKEIKKTIERTLYEVKWWVRKELSWLKNLPFK